MTAPPRDAEFYLRHSGYVRALARQVVFDAHAAEDIAQETWLAALERPPRDGSSPRGWLKSLVRGLASKAWLSSERREQRELARLDEQLAPPTPDEIVAHEYARRRVADALLALEEPYRSALWLRYFDELPPRAIAARLGLPVETVRTHQKRGLEKLRARLHRDSGAAWSLALVRSLELEPLSYRAVARAAFKALLRGLVVVSVAKKVFVASAAIAIAVTAFWLFERGRAVEPRAASLAPESSQLGVVAADVDDANVAAPAARSEVETATPKAPPALPSPTSTTSLLLHVAWGDDHTPAAHVGVQLHQHGVEDFYQDALRVETGDDGAVLVDPIRAGSLGVYFDRGGYDDVKIEAGVRNDATLELPAGFDVEGHVRDIDGRAVAGAEIYLYMLVGDTYEGSIVARSLEDGSYSVRSVDAGGLNYLSARAPFRAPTKQRMVMSVVGTKVKVDLVFEAAGGSVEGRVLAPDGSPCARAAVVVGRVNDFDEISFEDGSNGRKPAPQRAFTDATGSFVVAGVPTGTQSIQARAKGLAPWKGEVSIFEKRETPLEIRLALGARLEGSVRDASGAPVVGAEVNVAGGAGFTASHRRTGDDGAFAIDGLPLGEFGVAIESTTKGSAETKLVGVSGATLRWDAVLSRGHVLRGRVEAPGEELAKWWIELYVNNAMLTRFGPVSTDAAGRFEFIDCPDASMRLTLHRPSSSVWPAAVLDDVRATGDELVIRPDPAFDPSVRIRGRIVDPDGRAVSGAQIIPGLAGFNNSPILLSETDGRFALGPWPAGKWSLRVKARGFADLALERRVLASGETWEFGDLALQRGGQVAVNVRKAADVAESKPQLVLTSVDTGLDEWLALDGDVARSRPLVAGRYRLIASGEGIALATQDVVVTDGAETRVDVLVRRGNPLRVHIDDASALGQRIDCSLADETGRLLFDGSFVPTIEPIEWTTALAPGRYRFTARVAGREGVLDLDIGTSAAPADFTLRIP